MDKTVKYIKRIEPSVVAQLKDLIGCEIYIIIFESGEFTYGDYFYLRGRGECYLHFFSPEKESYYLWFHPGTSYQNSDRTLPIPSFPMELKKYKRTPTKEWLDPKSGKIDYSKAPFPNLTKFNLSVGLSHKKGDDPADSKILHKIKIYQHIAEYEDTGSPNTYIDLVAFILFELKDGRKLCFEINSSYPEATLHIDNEDYFQNCLKSTIEELGPTFGEPCFQLLHEVS